MGPMGLTQKQSRQEAVALQEETAGGMGNDNQDGLANIW